MVAGLNDAAAHASNPEEQRHAARAVAARPTRVVLHLEPHVGPYSTLFPRDFSAAKVLQKLKQLVGHIDKNPLVVNISNSTGRVP